MLYEIVNNVKQRVWNNYCPRVRNTHENCKIHYIIYRGIINNGIEEDGRNDIYWTWIEEK